MSYYPISLALPDVAGSVLSLSLCVSDLAGHVPFSCPRQILLGPSHLAVTVRSLGLPHLAVPVRSLGLSYLAVPVRSCWVSPIVWPQCVCLALLGLSHPTEVMTFFLPSFVFFSD